VAGPCQLFPQLLSQAHGILAHAAAALDADVLEAAPLLRTAADAAPAASCHVATMTGAGAAFLSAVDTDLLLHRAHTLASMAEVSLLLALWHAWGNDLGGKTVPGTGCGGSSHGNIFTFSPEQQDLLGPSVRACSATAGQALRLFQQHDGLCRNVGSSGSMSTSEHNATIGNGIVPLLSACGADYGVESGGGISRPLRLLALVHLLEHKPVLSEGLVRGALDRLQDDIVWRDLVGRAAGQLEQEHNGAEAGGPPVWARAAGGACDLVFGHLLLQWEKREPLGATLVAAGSNELRAAAASTQLVGSPHTEIAPRKAFLWLAAVAAAAGTSHVGSCSQALEGLVAEAFPAD